MEKDLIWQSLTVAAKRGIYNDLFIQYVTYNVVLKQRKMLNEAFSLERHWTFG